MTLAEVIADIERRFTCVVGIPSALCREAYVVIGIAVNVPPIPGTVPEGTAHELGFDEETAIFGFMNAFEHYAEGRKGTLYWRVRPTIESGRVGRKKRYKVRCRLIITDKPVIYKNEQDADGFYIKIDDAA